MEDNAAEKTSYTEVIECPGCSQPIDLEFQLLWRDDKLYVWFEGMCHHCQHKIVDPLPRANVQLTDVANRLMAN